MGEALRLGRGRLHVRRRLRGRADIFEHKNGLLSSYSIVTMMSGIGGLAGRNAGGPLIVLDRLSA